MTAKIATLEVSAKTRDSENCGCTHGHPSQLCHVGAASPTPLCNLVLWSSFSYSTGWCACMSPLVPCWWKLGATFRVALGIKNIPSLRNDAGCQFYKGRVTQMFFQLLGLIIKVHYMCSPNYLVPFNKQPISCKEGKGDCMIFCNFLQKLQSTGNIQLCSSLQKK